MSQFLFIHGTSVRKEDYNQTIFAIEKRLKSLGHTVSPCIWGDNFGVPDQGWGDSIPGFNDDNPKPPDPDEALWILLFQDPFFRLRELKADDEHWSAFQDNPGDPIWRAFNEIAIPKELLAIVATRGLTPFWDKNLAKLKDGQEFAAVVRAVPKPPAEVSVDLARAVVASFLIEATEAGAPAMMPLSRDKMVDLLAAAIGVEKGLFDRPISFVVRGSRNRAMKIFMKYAADILLYQSRGEGIQTAVRTAIQKADGKVVVLAHSLGGVAAVDVLAKDDLRHKVSHLITAGSQAPFIYDVNALNSLSQVKTLPPFFPENWLNIYDESDVLSFLAEPVFSPARVTDFANYSKLAPLAAHSAYWDSDAVWNRISEFVA
ncbi:MAG: hypothetical protein ACKV2U_30795 [Bryobacteraceae bacterium]